MTKSVWKCVYFYVLKICSVYLVDTCKVDMCMECHIKIIRKKNVIFLKPQFLSSLRTQQYFEQPHEVNTIILKEKINLFLLHIVSTVSYECKRKNFPGYNFLNFEFVYKDI